MSISTVASAPTEASAGKLAVGVQDAARITGVSVDWLNQLRSKGTGPRYCKVGRRALYRVADLEAWLSEHVQPSRAA